MRRASGLPIRIVGRDPPLVAALGLFAIGVTAGAVVPGVPSSPGSPVREAPTTWFFVAQNLPVVVAMFVGGVTFGVITVVSLCYNGFVVGYAITSGGPDLATALSLFPHGLLELPALWLAGAAGLRVPYGFLLYVTDRREELVARRDVTAALGSFVLACLLVLVAAWLEANVTPRLLEVA